MAKRVSNNTPGLLVFAALINIVLAVGTTRSAAGQSSGATRSPIFSVDIVEQPDCPLNLKILNVDIKEIGPNISFEVQNGGVKSVYAFDLIVRFPDKVERDRPYFLPSFLQSGERNAWAFDPTTDLEVKDRYDNAYLAIDHIVFSDGTSWGSNSQKRSMLLVGSLEGRRMAVRHLKDMVRAGEWDRLSDMMTAELEAIAIMIPLTNNDTDYGNGFRSGYKSVLRELRTRKPDDRQKIIETINSLAD